MRKVKSVCSFQIFLGDINRDIALDATLQCVVAKDVVSLANILAVDFYKTTL